MRKIKIVPNEYYHIYNRGNNKQNIFLDNRDWSRFLFLILYFQSSVPIYNIGHHISHFIKYRVFNISGHILQSMLKDKSIELIGFCLMLNHFHLIIRELKENGISKYMEKVQKAYAKYFNAKYKKSGHLFQGPFQIVHIKNNEQLLHLSAYIHRNAREIKEWKNKEEEYPWSSYQDYLGENRWRELLMLDVILDQFSTPEEYKDFVDTSGTKLELDEKLLLESY